MYKYSNLTIEERKDIKKFIDKGFSLSSISKIINRSKNVVVMEVS